MYMQDNLKKLRFDISVSPEDGTNPPIVIYQKGKPTFMGWTIEEALDKLSRSMDKL